MAVLQMKVPMEVQQSASAMDNASSVASRAPCDDSRDAACPAVAAA